MSTATHQDLGSENMSTAWFGTVDVFGDPRCGAIDMFVDPWCRAVYMSVAIDASIDLSITNFSKVWAYLKLNSNNNFWLIYPFSTKQDL